MKVDDVVMLVPGFLGFSHFGGFPYFSQSVATGIRVALEFELERKSSRSVFRIEPLTTVPAGNLAERQTALSRQIVDVVGRLGTLEEPPRVHLVGHSTGGLDAQLFVSARSLSPGGTWSPNQAKVRRAVRSVVGIAVPAAGSGLALSPLGKLLATGSVPSVMHPRAIWQEILARLEGTKDLVEVIRAIAALGPANAAIGQLIAGGLDDLHPLLRFVESLLMDRSLLQDLRPEVIGAIAQGAGNLDTGNDLSPRIRRYLTIAQNHPSTTPTGKLFAALHTMCAAGLSGNARAKRVAAAIQGRIKGEALRVIGATPLPPLSEEASDGVVNTALQIPSGGEETIATGLEQVAAVVIADHLDVVGGFPMTDQPSPEANGFLNSGSKFRAPEFSALYRSVARDIADAIPT